MGQAISKLVHSIPKPELRVHLEGSITIETLNLLALRKGLPAFESSPYKYSNFKEFDALFPKLGPYFDMAEDFYEIAVGFGQRLATDGQKRFLDTDGFKYRLWDEFVES